MDSTFFDFAELDTHDVYKLISGCVVPRPIAWVTTLDNNGKVNAAPYSFFNVFGADPPIVAINIGDRSAESPGAPQGGPKDSARLIRERGEFVINLVPYDLFEQMSLSATDFPPGMSEVEALKLELAPSRKIAVPRLAGSPASLECREHTTLQIGNNRMVIGVVVAMHIRSASVDAEKKYVDTPSLDLVGRMGGGGGGGYVRTGDEFHMARLNYAQWLEREEKTSD